MWKVRVKVRNRGGLLEARFELTLTKNSINLSAITFLLVIDVLFVLKDLGKF